MAELLWDSAGTEEKEKGKLDQASELKKSEDQLEFSLSELDDFELSFDAIKEWVAGFPECIMEDLKQSPDGDGVGLEKVELGAIGSGLQMNEQELCENINVGEGIGDGSVCFKTSACSETPSFGIGSGKAKLGDADKVSRMPEDLVESGKLGTLACLVIEEEMGKVSLGVSNCSDLADINGLKEPRGVEASTGEGLSLYEMEAAKCDGVVVGTVDHGLDEVGNITSVNENHVNSDEDASDEDESDSQSESESDSSSSSSSSSDEEEGSEFEDEEKEAVGKVKSEEQMDLEDGEIRDYDADEMVTWSGDEDDINGGVPEGPIRTKNELKFLPPVPPVDVTIQQHHQTLPVGVVLSVLGSQVVVEGLEQHSPLNEGSVLWITEKRLPLGIIDEVFGPVKNPFYIVRYNSDSEVPPGIQQGASISFVPEFVSHVLNNNNLYKKGYDASGENDEELSDEAEFSDDEKEAEYKRMLKMSKRTPSDQRGGNWKKDKNKHQARKWKSDQLVMEVPAGSSQPPNDQKRPPIPPITVPMRPPSMPAPCPLNDQNPPLMLHRTGQIGAGNFSSPSIPGQSFAGGPVLVPSFPQFAQPPTFIATPNGILPGSSCQQPANVSFPSGFPAAAAMPWLQQNNLQQPYQMMPLVNGMLFQQQFFPNQRMPVNFVPPGQGNQSNFGSGQAFQGVGLCQTGFGQTPFGFGQQGHPPMNVGGEGMPSNGLQVHSSGLQRPSNELQVEKNHDLQPPFTSGNNEAPQNFNQGVNSGRSRKMAQRGRGRLRGRFGGRFGARRGRQQSQ